MAQDALINSIAIYDTKTNSARHILLSQSFGIAKQAYSVMLDPQDMGDKPDAKELKIQDGKIVFENVSFHYGEKKLFSNKHAHIHGGEKVGLVGFTGAGKSTFISLPQ